MSDPHTPRKTDDHIEMTTEQARQGKTHQGVRWVLIISTSLTAAALLGIWLGYL